MGERIGMDIVNMIWDRCDVAVQDNRDDYQNCKMEILRLFAMDIPFTEEQLKEGNINELVEITFNAAIDKFKEKSDTLSKIAFPVIKQVYENHGQMYENILIPITDGKRVYNISCNLKRAYDTECKAVVEAFEKAILLHFIDEAWMENLRELDDLRQSVRNASYEQKDPLLIYKLESVKLFDYMVDKINDKTITVLMRGQIPIQDPAEVQEAAPEPQKQAPQYREEKQDLSRPEGMDEAAAKDTREQPKNEPYVAPTKVGRNDPCPCGSGKKFKHCHGKNA